MLRTIDIDLRYQPLIDGPPVPHEELYRMACAGDGNTVDHWRDKWISHYKAAKEHFGDLGSRTYGQLFGINKHKAAIVIGSGPSLKTSLDGLRENQALRDPLLTISCLHNFGYFEDEGIEPDFYLTLDAGKVVLKDIAEGRKEGAEHYWERTKGKKLIAYAGTDPELWKLWRGDVYLFNSLIPDMKVRQAFNDIEQFDHYISSGGNALGACMYTAKAVMGSTKIIYVGADFCFSWDNTFHSYKTGYDVMGHTIGAVDVYGLPRRTWQSYMNFKYWFDRVACMVPGDWVSCSEGLLGAYQEGNIRQFKYCSLHEAIYPYKCVEQVTEQEFKKDSEGKTEVIGEKALDLEEFWKNTKQDRPLTLF